MVQVHKSIVINSSELTGSLLSAAGLVLVLGFIGAPGLAVILTGLLLLLISPWASARTALA